MKLSVVTTLYHSAPYLGEFWTRVTATARRIAPDYEIVFVNDGSPDDALAVALALQAGDERVRIIDLSRNFGHHPAIMTGLAHATGDWVFLIDCDLEEDPELLEPFLEEQRRTQADVVFGVQNRRGGSLFERCSGWAYYKIFNLLSSCPIPVNLMTIRLMSRRYVQALLQHREVEFVISGLWALTGFLQVPVTVTKKRRRGTTYSFLRKVHHLVNSLTSFSNKPLYYIFYLGVLIVLLSGTAASWMIMQRLYFGTMAAGWASLIVSIWFLGGLMLFCQGVIGIYLSKVFMESKRRPATLIRAIHEGRSPAARQGHGRGLQSTSS